MLGKEIPICKLMSGIGSGDQRRKIAVPLPLQDHIANRTSASEKNNGIVGETAELRDGAAVASVKSESMLSP